MSELGSSGLQQLLIAFISGLGTVLTPCIYPLIPVTLSLFGVTANLSRWKAFLLSGSYVAGICLTYTVLGIFSGKTGALFGSMLGNPVVALVLCAFFLLLALFSLEVIELPIIGKLQNRASQIGGRGYGGAFLMGTVSGFVAAPCAGPILIAILALAAQSQNTAWGALLLFTYAFGFGLVFLVLGTFSNLTKSLPRAGNWMGSVKFITGAALFGVIWFLIKPFAPRLFEVIDALVPDAIQMMLIALSVTLAFYAYRRGTASLKLGAALVCSLAVFQLLLVHPASRAHADWATSLESALQRSQQQKKIAMVDLYAEWCGACKEFDALTFSDPRVKQKLSNFVTARLDFSLPGEAQQAIQDKYEVVGLPCILFLNPDGSEIPDTKVIEFENADQFLATLDKVLATSH